MAHAVSPAGTTAAIVATTVALVSRSTPQVSLNTGWVAGRREGAARQQLLDCEILLGLVSGFPGASGLLEWEWVGE